MSTSKSSSKKRAKKKDDGIVENVIGIIRTSFLAGLGMALLGEEKIEAWAKKIAKENKMAPKDIEKFIKDVKRDSVQARKDVEKRLREMMKEITGSSKEKSKGGSKKTQRKKKK
jgi:polyhydroxyalkanoate synthesis regulator phasin